MLHSCNFVVFHEYVPRDFLKIGPRTSTPVPYKYRPPLSHENALNVDFVWLRVRRGMQYPCVWDRDGLNLSCSA